MNDDLPFDKFLNLNHRKDDVNIASPLPIVSTLSTNFILMVFEKNNMSPRMLLIKPLTKFLKNVKA